MVTRPVVPPSAGGLLQGGHSNSTRAFDLQLPARLQVLAGGDGVPAAGHSLHDQHADYGIKSSKGLLTQKI